MSLHCAAGFYFAGALPAWRPGMPPPTHRMDASSRRGVQRGLWFFHDGDSPLSATLHPPPNTQFGRIRLGLLQMNRNVANDECAVQQARLYAFATVNSTHENHHRFAISSVPIFQPGVWTNFDNIPIIQGVVFKAHRQKRQKKAELKKMNAEKQLSTYEQKSKKILSGGTHCLDDVELFLIHIFKWNIQKEKTYIIWTLVLSKILAKLENKLKINCKIPTLSSNRCKKTQPTRQGHRMKKYK